MFDLSGRVAMVTGCSVGLGRQMAEGLAEMGANLVLCSSLELEKSILAHPAEFGKNGSGVRDR
jgi:NAD(P)-dependent dehydrogenase (short-subunit alcohol dehydrogenase family)